MTAANQAKQVFEALVLRSAPGILNVYALLLLSAYLSSRDYGLFSTALASSTLISNLAFGPIKLAVLPHRAISCSNGKGEAFDGAVAGAALTIFVPSVSAALMIMPVAPQVSALLLLVVLLGLFTTLQEILHSKLHLWRFSGAALVQALTLVLITLTWLQDKPTLESVLWTYCAGYAFGSAASYLLAGKPQPTFPSKELLRRLLATGIPFTLSNLSESWLHLGFRYLLLARGSSSTLAIFSFSVDIAQRLIGIVISVASFAIVPRAYNVAASSGQRAFRKMLFSGAALASVVAFIMMFGVLAIARTGIIEALSTPIFVPSSFVIVSLALMTNRLKKLAIDPIAVECGRVHIILWGYLTAVPLALGLTAICLHFNFELGIYYSYLVGCLIAFSVTLYPVYSKSSPI
jgi:O-antigen/teichoic acid export membrane protein